MDIPKRLTIETIFGCNANCTMCVINTPTKRKKGVMPLEMSNKIMDELAPYTDKIKMLDLFGLGEPLLDPYIFERIRYAKQKGFQSIAISTNADLLTEEKQRKLLDSGIDAVLFSIDGVKKDTHEGIRRGVTFERVVENVKSIIRIRDKGEYKTRFIIRFIKQESNKDQWKDYKAFWKPLLTKDKDLMIIYDMHTWGGEIQTKESLLNKEKDPEIERKPCHHLQNLIILADGTVPLCSEDFLHAKHNFGNVKDQPALKIFNSPRFKAIREKHEKGDKNTMIPCKECTVLYSEKTRKDEKI